jgi:hypothetical protein
LVLRVDNYSIHRSVTRESFMKTRHMVSMPHPPCSPDLAPRDFYFFPTVKKRLKHTGITDGDQLSEELHTILRSIPGEELERVFETWREGVHNVKRAMESTLTNKQLRNTIGWLKCNTRSSRMYLFTRRYIWD